MSHSTRIIVVGAGIVGASVAYHLARRGVAVVVVEGVEAGSATCAGAGIICPWVNPDDDPAYRLGAVGALCLAGEAARTRTGARADDAAVDLTSLREIEAHVSSQVPDYPEIGEVS